MLNQIGNYSLYIALLSSILIIIQSPILLNRNNINVSGRIFSLISIQSLMIIISFIALIIAFIIPDFSNETVYNNSHTSKPLFYKISGTWGNHEGSLLLWLLVLSIFLLIFTITSKNLSNQLSSKENLLVSQLKEGDQLSLDELSVRCSFPVYETMSLLTLLELNKYVKKNQNGKFELL